MKIIFVIFLIPLLLTAADFNRLYDRYQQPRIFLHERINYDFDLSGKLEWNRKRFIKNGLRVNYGSVSKTGLLRNEQLQINQDLTDRFLFNAFYSAYEGRIYAQDIEFRSLSLHYEFIEGFYAGASVSPYSDKDKIDTGFGIIWLDETRENYISAEFLFEDIVYDKRNTHNGNQINDPFKILWKLRYNYGFFTVHSSGSAGRGYKRDYDNPYFEGTGLQTEKNVNSASLMFEVKAAESNIIVFHGHFYSFFNSRTDMDPLLTYEYVQDVIEYGIRHKYVLREQWSFTAGLRSIRLLSEMNSEDPFEIERNEIMPEFRIRYEHGLFSYGISYFSTFQDIESKKIEMTNINTYEDKAEANFVIEFTENSRLVLSISHVTTINGFGGGNAKYVMYF